MDNHKEETDLLKIRSNKTMLEWMWRAVAENVARGVPSTPADSAFLMELMSDLAKFEPKKDAPSTVFDITLPPEKMSALWHCINVTIANKFFKVPYAISVLSAALQEAAEVLDLYLKETTKVASGPVPTGEVSLEQKLMEAKAKKQERRFKRAKLELIQ